MPRDGVRGVEGRGEEGGNVAQDFKRELGDARRGVGGRGGTIIVVHAIMGCRIGDVGVGASRLSVYWRVGICDVERMLK